MMLFAAGLAAGFALHCWMTSRKGRSSCKAQKCAPTQPSKQEPTPLGQDTSSLLQRAARQDSFFNKVMSLIPCQVFIKDPLDGFRYKIANRNFIDYYRLEEKNVLEHVDEDLFELDVAQQLHLNDAKVCANPGKVFRFDEDVSFHRRGKETFKSLKLCFETEDHHPYMLGICVDVTELTQSVQSLKKTQSLLNLVINSLPVNIFAKNLDDQFRYSIANQAFANFVGKKPSEIIGKTDAEIFSDDTDAKNFRQQDEEVVSSGKSFHLMEHPYDCKGTKRFLQTLKKVTSSPEGNRLLLGVSIDVTEMINLNRSQKVIQQCLEALVAETDINEGINSALKSICDYIDVSRVYIVHFDFEKKHTSCVREYLGEGEVPFMDKMQSVPFSTNLDWEKYFAQKCFLNFPKLQNEETLKLMGPYYGDLAKKANVHSLYCHRLIVDGKFWGYVGLAYSKKVRVLDKSELDFVQSAARFIELMIRHKRTQLELREAVEKSHAAEKAKSNFLATMSHEIRTPLNAVIGYSELLKGDTLPPEEQKDYLNDISIAGNALLSLINSILDLSKLEAGKMCFANTLTDFPQLVKEVMIVFHQKLYEKHLEGHMEVPEMPLIKIDPLRLRQILFNLIGNAVKFTDKGSITITVSFTPDEDQKTGTLKIAVKDTGCGISEEDRAKVFRPFEQSRTILGTRVASVGTGLGLAIIHRMVEYMNGEVSLDSTPGKGSVFTITLSKIDYADKKSLGDAQAHLEKPDYQLPPCKILIVDDIPMNLKVMNAQLHHLGMETVSANNADAALSALAFQHFDVMLTDLWMPGINGDELAAKIRRSGKYPDLLIGVVTADTEIGGSFDISVFDEILTKPLSSEKIKHFIGKHFSQNKAPSPR